MLSQQLPQPDVFIMYFCLEQEPGPKWVCFGTADEDNEDQQAGRI